ncbi:hypothetical protein BT96DRAFT_919009 [Gymnopus androsaceus JB14]|uniref:Uncharacterized protein n=1 Tax=Gymnopus androsaceus JB14 TaxID=1447944 RepID=A0A6A4HW92_9AGAR|nr:hypothetical protein BT96DRAFT_919009 [Gymnopus androsaceus JB14]
MRFYITIVALLCTVIAFPIARVDPDRLDIEVVAENASRRSDSICDAQVACIESTGGRLLGPDPQNHGH